MKNKIKYIAFSLMLMLFLSTNVNAGTIRESANTSLEPGTLVIGITKFSNDTVLTAAKSSTAGFNDALFKMSNNLPLEEPKVYLYYGGSENNQIWFEIEDSGKANVIEKEEIPAVVDIYYVNNVEKVIEVPYDGDLVKESLPKGIEYDEVKDIFYVPATKTEFEFKTTDGGTKVASLDVKEPDKGVEISEVKYSITYYDTKGKIIGEPVLLGSNDRSVKPIDPIQEFDIFEGWKIKDTNNFFVFGDPITKNVELIASFKDADYLKVDLNYDGSSNYNIKGIIAGKTFNDSLVDVKNSLKTPTRSEYRFLGWYLEEDCTTTFDPATTTLTSGMTIYAKWAYDWYLTGLDTSSFMLTKQDHLNFLIDHMGEVNTQARTIIINDNTVELNRDFEIPSDFLLTVNSGLTLKKTLTVSGTLTVNGTIVGESDTVGIIAGSGTLINDGEITAAVRQSLMDKYKGSGYISLPSRKGTIYIASEGNKLGDTSGTGGDLNYTLNKNELTIKPQDGKLIQIATNPAQYGSDAAYWVGFRVNMPEGTTDLSTRKWYKLVDGEYEFVKGISTDTNTWAFGAIARGFYQSMDKGKAQFQYQLSYKMNGVSNFEVYTVIFDIEEKDLSGSIKKDLGTITLNRPEFTINNDIQVLVAKKVTIAEGTTVTIPAGKTLTVNGTLDIKGNLVVNGTLTNNGTITGNITLAGTLKQNTALKDNTITMVGDNALIETPFGTNTMSFAGTSTGVFIASKGAVIKTYASTNTKQGAALIEIEKGNLTLTSDHIMTPNSSVTINEGTELIIPTGKTLYNYGSIINKGTLTIYGTLTDINNIADGPLTSIWTNVTFETSDFVENRGITGSGIIDIKGTFNNNGLLSTTGVTNLYGTMNNAGIIATNVKMAHNDAVIKTPWKEGWITFAGVNNNTATFSLTLNSAFKTVIPQSTKAGAIDIIFIDGTTTLNSDHIITPNARVTIAEKAKFIIPEGKTLYNYGAIVNNGTLTINGTLSEFNSITDGPLTTTWGDTFEATDFIENRGLTGEGITNLYGTVNNAGVIATSVKMKALTSVIKTPWNSGWITFAGVNNNSATFNFTLDSEFKTAIPTSTKVGAIDIEFISGTITLNSSHIITPNAKVTIDENAKFIIPTGKTLSNYGSIVNNGTLTIDGTLSDYDKITDGGLTTTWGNIFTNEDIIENRGITGSGVIDIKGTFNNNGLISTTGVTNLYGKVKNASIIATKVVMKDESAVVETPWNDGWITFAGVNNNTATFSLTLNSEFNSIKPTSTKVGAIDIEFISGTTTLNNNHIITPNARITIGKDANFIIASGKTLSNYGQIVVKGTLTINGTLDNYTDVTKGYLKTYWGENTFTNVDKISNEEYIYSEGTVINDGSILVNGSSS